MPMNNSLNVSELLKRLGVVGDSKGSAPILEELRLVVNLADLRDLVPPVPVPMGGAAGTSNSGAATLNQFTLECKSAGGLRINGIFFNTTGEFKIWHSGTNPFAASLARPTGQLVFGQTAVSTFRVATPEASVSIAENLLLKGNDGSLLLRGGNNWVGPGQFFNIEAQDFNQSNVKCTITWIEYTASLNP